MCIVFFFFLFWKFYSFVIRIKLTCISLGVHVFFLKLYNLSLACYCVVASNIILYSKWDVSFEIVTVAVMMESNKNKHLELGSHILVDPPRGCRIIVMQKYVMGMG